MCRNHWCILPTAATLPTCLRFFLNQNMIHVCQGNSTVSCSKKLFAFARLYFAEFHTWTLSDGAGLHVRVMASAIPSAVARRFTQTYTRVDAQTTSVRTFAPGWPFQPSAIHWKMMLCCFLCGSRNFYLICLVCEPLTTGVRQGPTCSCCWHKSSGCI